SGGEHQYDFVIVGGGIAGVTCAETLAALEPDARVLIVSASPVVKAVTNLRPVTKLLEEFDVELRASLANPEPSAAGEAAEVRIGYGELCLCTGASPKLIPQARQHPDLVVGIRDTETVADLSKKLSTCRRVLVVGNGGIATELVYELRNVDVVWAVRQDSIGAVFFDAGAAQFLLPSLARPGGARVDKPGEAAELLPTDTTAPTDSWPVFAALSNGELLGVDLIVSATGVTPTALLADGGVGPALDAEGAVAVDRGMRSSLAHVFAAGDACGCAGWSSDGETSSAAEETRLWFQMRLWSQARQTGSFAARCMSAARRGESPPPLDIGFELFTHVTRFFSYKIVLLGLYNAQGLASGEYEALLRVTPGVEYVKCVMHNGRMQGCVLIGETDLEETFENLILNQLDLSQFGEHLLDPGVDIDDYFD
uniref:Pyr_redox_2 domain-containing protein n=1 Tax=Macrostomum lignano TaxID=282301 RepID=A0A1I8H3N9_9PLAT